jgi:hypothetical protein
MQLVLRVNCSNRRGIFPNKGNQDSNRADRFVKQVKGSGYDGILRDHGQSLNAQLGES